MRVFSSVFPLILGAFMALALLGGCNDELPTPPPPIIGKMQLTVADSGYETITLRLGAPEGVSPMDYVLQRNGDVVS